jgi:hypothetical protein
MFVFYEHDSTLIIIQLAAAVTKTFNIEGELFLMSINTACPSSFHA